jgi:hypothetical protein
MSTDKLFILLLVVLLPLTGCLDTVEPADAGSVVDADSHTHSVNTPPVIYGNWYGGVRFHDYYDYDTSTLHEDVLVFEGMVRDIDGIVVQFGVDTDLDGVIDYQMPRASGYAEWNQTLSLMITDNTSWMNPIDYDGYDYCFQWIQLIAVDDDGAMQIVPYRAIFEQDDETDLCLLEHN